MQNTIFIRYHRKENYLGRRIIYESKRCKDLRLEEFELPEITDDEILVKVISDSICMSTYKCAILGTEHKRVYEDVAEHPAIMGHEFAGDIIKV